MGMYTGLRFRGFVKPEYREMIRDINQSGYWLEFKDKFPFLANFADLERCSCIPMGGLSYMPYQWEDKDNILTSSFKRNIDMETGYWTFQCSLKNYDDEIGTFLLEVVPVICSSTEYIEYLYEEWDSSVLYELKDGKVTTCGKNVYQEDYDYDSNEFRWGY